VATEPLAELGLVPRCRVNDSTTDLRQSHHYGPAPRERRSVVGPTVAGWAVSLGLSSLVESTRGCERRTARGLFALRSQNLATLAIYERFTSGKTPRHRDAFDPLDA